MSHVSGLAHSGHDHATRTFENDLARAREVVVDPGQETAQGVDFRSNDVGPESEKGALAHAVRGVAGERTVPYWK